VTVVGRDESINPWVELSFEKMANIILQYGHVQLYCDSVSRDNVIICLSYVATSDHWLPGYT